MQRCHICAQPMTAEAIRHDICNECQFTLTRYLQRRGEAPIVVSHHMLLFLQAHRDTLLAALPPRPTLSVSQGA
jgi:hypothetical protein